MTEKKKQVLFIIAIFAILLIGAIISGIIWWNSVESNKHTVKFFDHKNALIAEYKVEDGESILFDQELPELENSVFKGWDKNLSSITEDTEVYPIYQSITKDSNAFYIDTYYINGGDDVWIDLKIGGNVDMKSAKIGIAYDSDIFTYIEHSSSEYISSVEANDEYLLLSFDFAEKNIQNGSILKLHFECADVDFLVTDLPIDLLNLQSQDGLTGGTSVKGNIYIY